MIRESDSDLTVLLVLNEIRIELGEVIEFLLELRQMLHTLEHVTGGNRRAFEEFDQERRIVWRLQWQGEDGECCEGGAGEDTHWAITE